MTKPVSRRSFAMTGCAALAVPAMFGGAITLAQAQQGYPNRPIRFVLAFGAGGVADIAARIVAEKLGEKLGQRIVVENQPGPGGIAAARTVLTAPPDGYTLALLTNGTAISVGAYNALPFDPVKDFAPVSALGTFDLILGTNANSKYKTLEDFIKAARAQPGKLNVGTINVGGTQNLAAELFKSSAGVNFQIIPYRSTPEIIIAVLRNDVDLMVDFYAPMKSALDDNQIRPLATSGVKRVSYLPNVPTVPEAGVPGYEVVAWNGLFVRNGTPAEIVNHLLSAMRDVLANPDLVRRYAELGVEAKSSTPAEVQERLKADIVKWSAVIDKAGIPKQ